MTLRVVNGGNFRSALRYFRFDLGNIPCFIIYLTVFLYVDLMSGYKIHIHVVMFMVVSCCVFGPHFLEMPKDQLQQSGDYV